MGFALVFLKYLVKPFTIPVQYKMIIKHSGIPLEILQTVASCAYWYHTLQTGHTMSLISATSSQISVKRETKRTLMGSNYFFIISFPLKKPLLWNWFLTPVADIPNSLANAAIEL